MSILMTKVSLKCLSYLFHYFLHLQWFCASLWWVVLLSQAWALKNKDSKKDGHGGLKNAHIKVAFGPWSPYIMWKCKNSASWTENAKLGKGSVGDWGDDCPNNEERIFSGMMWDLINFMAERENFTFSVVESQDVCGHCASANNCSGMTGMVNRGEVDIAFGKQTF